MTSATTSKDNWIGNIYNFRSIDKTRIDNAHIKYNHIFRGGFYFTTGEEDIITLKTEKRIGTMIDLRSSDEIQENYQELVENSGLNYFNAPLIPFWRSVLYMFLRVSLMDFIHGGIMMFWALISCKITLFITAMKSTCTSFPLGWFFPVVYYYGQKELNGLFKFIAKHSETPFIFFCSFGKDRTGLIACMLEMLLGADVESCIEDYELSDQCLDDHLIVARDHFKRFGGSEKGIEIAKTNSKLLIDFDQYVKKNYGTIDKYFMDFVGLTQDDINIIRNNCLVLQED
ncbi:Tyrosine phosphatase [Entamoeba marina]